MKCKHCGSTIKQEPEQIPDELYIVVDRAYRRKGEFGKNEFPFKPVSSTFRTKKAAQDFSIVANRPVYKCVRAGSTNGSGGRKR